RRLPTNALSAMWGSWIFGSLLMLFFVCVFAFAPPTLPQFRQRILALLSATLAGVFGYFFTGSVGVHLGANRTSDKAVVRTGISVAGGAALFVIVLFWWFSPFAPVRAN